ncbi:MAG: energy transducer TonB [Bacteroidetes bacterium]|nr:MAG: energy transducer TonB [Bacteroidota bacterium]
MKTKHVESLEEMVFRNKNKLYGAYSLRRKYNKYLTLSLVMAFFLMLFGLAYPVIASFMNRHTGMNINENTTIGVTLPPPVADTPPVPPPPPPPPDPIVNNRFVVPKIVSDSIDSEFGKQAVLADNKLAPPPGIEPDATPVDNKSESTIATGVKPPPETSVQEMPSFPGGDEALFAFLRKNLKYPQEARELEMTGIVYVSFVVEKDGSITEVTLVRGVGNICDEEAMRVIKSMPDWTPGKQNNIPVRVRYNLPIKFILH